MAAAGVTPPGSLDLLQPGFSKALLGATLEDKYLCSACKNVLRRPFQAQCGHRYCSCCLASILRYGGHRVALGSSSAPGEMLPGGTSRRKPEGQLSVDTAVVGMRVKCGIAAVPLLPCCSRGFWGA